MFSFLTSKLSLKHRVALKRLKHLLSLSANGKRSLLIYQVDSIDKIKRIEPRIECKCVRVTKENYSQAFRFMEPPEIAEGFKERLSSGQVGIFAQHKDEMVGVLWATLRGKKNINKDDKYVTVNENESNMQSLYIDTKYRSNNISFFLYYEILKIILVDEKFDRVLLDIADSNYKGAKALEYVGCEPYYKLNFFELFGIVLFKERVQLKK